MSIASSLRNYHPRRPFSATCRHSRVGIQVSSGLAKNYIDIVDIVLGEPSSDRIVQLGFSPKSGHLEPQISPPQTSSCPKQLLAKSAVKTLEHYLRLGHHSAYSANPYNSIAHAMQACDKPVRYLRAQVMLTGKYLSQKDERKGFMAQTRLEDDRSEWLSLVSASRILVDCEFY